ncbi:MAG: complex I subunit 4 family protein [Myxococcota bacterium]
MDFILSHILTLMTFIPLIGIVPVALIPSRYPQYIKYLSVGISAVVFLLSLLMYAYFDRESTQLQFVEHYVWIRAFNIEYFMGVDGLNVSLVILTALISLIACIASLGIEKKVKGYFAMFLLLMTGMMGTFVALDLFLFYIFWEVMLLPMYFLIGIWGGPRKEYAAIKFFLYTLFGSVLMLIGIIALYYNSEPTTLVDGTSASHTFNIMKLTFENNFSNKAPLLGISFAKFVFVLFFIGFAIKIPMFPFHTWLPDAHVEAPTPISVILAGILLKMGIYGILRVNYQILPEATLWSAPVVAIFGVINIVYAAFVCMAQEDLKKLIAYSSVSHMGFSLLAMSSFSEAGISGAVLQLFTHGVISPMLFLIAGVIYDRAHHREINKFGGLANIMPEYSAFTGLAFMASLGLPGLAGFVAEALCFIGAFSTYKLMTVIAATSVVITAAYYLWTMQRVFLGPINPRYLGYKDLNLRERFTLYPLALIIVVLGVYPMLILDIINPTIFQLIHSIR